jgi:hypothetical protein
MAKRKEMKYLIASYNLLDPDQKEDYEFAKERPNVSAYIKRLIQNDRQRSLAPTSSIVVAPEEDDDKDYMKMMVT